MSYAATLTRAGQITVPKAVREILGILPGQRVTFRRKDDVVIIEREKTAMEIAEEIDALIPDEAREHHMKEYAGMTASEVQEKWLESPDAQEFFTEDRRKAL